MQIIRTRTRTRTRKRATDSIMLAVSIVSVVVVITMLLNARITHTAFAQAEKNLKTGILSKHKSCTRSNRNRRWKFSENVRR